MNTWRRKMIELTVLNSLSYKNLLSKKELVIYYAFDLTPFGNCLIAFMDSKICHFSFFENSKNRNLEILKKSWPKASFVEDEITAKSFLKRIFIEETDMEVLVRGTTFQEKVWRALLKIGKGETRCYSDVAAMIGCPRATRAVASAIARNPVSYLVPCHRVICKTGDILKFSGGASVKKKLLSFEGFL